MTTMRVPAWRKIGQSVNQAMTAEDAIKLGGLDFKVKVSENPVSTIIGEKSVEIANRYATYAELPNGDISGIGVVGNRYTPIQNREAFEMLNNIVDDSGAIFDTAGTLDGYSKCYITLKMPNTITVADGGDALETYLHCVNSHDGTSSFQIHVMFLRQICTNGLKGFRSGSAISLRHTANSVLKVQEARSALNLVFQEQADFQAEVEKLLATPMTDNQYRRFVEELVPQPEYNESPRGYFNAERTQESLLSLWKADTQQNVANTAWAAYNAVAEYADWFAPNRGKTESEAATRLAKRAIGTQSPLMVRAHQLLSV